MVLGRILLFRHVEGSVGGGLVTFAGLAEPGVRGDLDDDAPLVAGSVGGALIGLVFAGV